jgi:peptide/nickel transport system permease protein
VADGDTSRSSATIEPIDFDSVEGRRLRVRPRTLAFVVTVLVIAAAGYYEHQVIPNLVPFWGWTADPMGYLLYESLMVVLFFLVVPLAKRPALLKRYWWQLKSRYLALGSVLYLLFFAFVGIFGPGLVQRFNIGHVDSPYGPPLAQPPVGTTIQFNGGFGAPPRTCLGPVKNGYCHGTWNFPLGTTQWGADVIDLTVQGFRVALEISLVTAAIIVPIATVVGTAAAYYGGWIDELLMRYVDVQLVIPAVFLVIVLQQMIGRSLLHIVLVFGLLNWGGTARIVRAEALQRIEEGYVKAAESAGASSFAVLYRHVVPNVSNTIVTAVTQQMPMLIVAEVTIAYFGFGSPLAQSWGLTIGTGLDHFPQYWWLAVVPAVPMILTILAFHVVGDQMREIVDLQMEGSR